jgi:hypothetical protein
MKQLAVEFLSEKYMYVTWLTNRDEITSSEADKMRIKYFEEAKELEKQQIMDAYEAAMETDIYNTPLKVGKQYYNEIYNK